MEVSCSFDIQIQGWALKISDTWLIMVMSMAPQALLGVDKPVL